MTAYWRARKISIYLVEGAGSYRARGTHSAAPLWGWQPGNSPESCWCRSVSRGWRSWSLKSTDDGCSKRYTQAERSLSVLVDFLLFRFSFIQVLNLWDIASHAWDGSSPFMLLEHLPAVCGNILIHSQQPEVSFTNFLCIPSQSTWQLRLTTMGIFGCFMRHLGKEKILLGSNQCRSLLREVVCARLWCWQSFVSSSCYEAYMQNTPCLIRSLVYLLELDKRDSLDSDNVHISPFDQDLSLKASPISHPIIRFRLFPCSGKDLSQVLI